MASQEQLNILHQGVAAWNAWRASTPSAESPDLNGANLSGQNLQRVNFCRARLFGADLRNADLRNADLYRADLRQADLRWACLFGADLRMADLEGANLDGLKWTPAKPAVTAWPLLLLGGAVVVMVFGLVVQQLRLTAVGGALGIGAIVWRILARRANTDIADKPTHESD